MNIYVGNLSFSTTPEGLQQAFEEFGGVSASNVISDRDTGRSRGFGFVEMDDDSAGKSAIEALDGSELEGRTLRVNEARPWTGGGRPPRWSGLVGARSGPDRGQVRLRRCLRKNADRVVTRDSPGLKPQVSNYGVSNQGPP